MKADSKRSKYRCTRRFGKKDVVELFHKYMYHYIDMKNEVKDNQRKVDKKPDF